MSKELLSIMDHKSAGKDDMHYLIQPRGPGRSWVFRMVTPPSLVGLPNPWDGKPLGREIKRGLGTRYAHEARARRDVLLGDVRRLEMGAAGDDQFTLATAKEYRDLLKAEQAAGQIDDYGYSPMEHHISHVLDNAEAAGVSVEERKQFARIAYGSGFPISEARDSYVLARRANNPHGLHPLKKSTVNNLDTALKALRRFLKDDEGVAFLEDVTPKLARKFRDEFLPAQTTPRTPNGMSVQTITKTVNLIRGMWRWAIEFQHTSPKYTDPWNFPAATRRAKRDDAPKRDAFTPAEISALLKATERGTRQGDVIRLALATGCRVDEMATLKASDVRKDGSGFSIGSGKSDNARRHIPLVGEAKELLAQRISQHADSGRLFPDWPIRDSSGKAAAVSQWFTRFRREVLGRETDGRLALHSTRHTWRTVARRARLPEADINELGGWAGQRSSNSVYDHGLLEEQLTEVQQCIWDEMKRGGYLEGW